MRIVRVEQRGVDLAVGTYTYARRRHELGVRG